MKKFSEKFNMQGEATKRNLLFFLAGGATLICILLWAVLLEIFPQEQKDTRSLETLGETAGAFSSFISTRFSEEGNPFESEGVNQSEIFLQMMSGSGESIESFENTPVQENTPLPEELSLTSESESSF